MRLELPEKRHEEACREMLQEFFDNGEKSIPWWSWIEEMESYDAFLGKMRDYKEGKNLKPGYVPSTLYFLVNDDDRIIWMESIRHELNDALRFDAGNIGYSIRPSERRKWYAKEGLKLALEKCKEMGLDKVLLTCDKDNIGSSKTMIRNGWIRDSEYEHEGKVKERYRIPVK